VSVVAYVPDLMDRSKVAAAVPGVVVVRSLDDLVAAATPGTTVVVDLSRTGVLDAIRQIVGSRVIGFGSHVDAELLRAARAAGCETVLARSVFFSRIAEIVGYGDGGS
jgi:hypothetical protein